MEKVNIRIEYGDIVVDETFPRVESLSKWQHYIMKAIGKHRHHMDLNKGEQTIIIKTKLVK